MTAKDMRQAFAELARPLAQEAAGHSVAVPDDQTHAAVTAELPPMPDPLLLAVALRAHPHARAELTERPRASIPRHVARLQGAGAEA